jgi:hypothetical protein
MTEPARAKPEERCPIQDTHTRLHRSHTLWHQAQREYGHPDAFCTNLNATIQVLRTVTWILKKEQSAVPDFELWYAGWEERMKSDPLMRWLVEARNRIEKQGDLKTYSSARVSVLAGWNEPYPIAEAEVDPLLSTPDIAGRLPELAVPPAVRREGVLIIERRWVARDLPDHELLDVLAHCYGVVASLVADAHTRCGFVMRTFKAESHEPKPIRTEHLAGRLPCMVATAGTRSVRVHLSTGQLMTPVQVLYKAPDRRRMEEAAKRYGYSEGPFADRQPNEDVISRSAWWFEHAKRVLAKDGYHHTIALLESPESAQLHALADSDRAGLYVMMRHLADEVERAGAVGVIHIAEFWMAAQADLKPGQRPSESANKKEVLQVIAATADGTARVHWVEFRKNEAGQIEFGEDQVEDDPTAGFLEPIRRVWRRRAKPERGEPGRAQAS